MRIVQQVIAWLDLHNGSVSAFLTLAYVVTTYFILRSAQAANRLARELERSRNRPYVYLDFEVRSSYMAAFLKNSGLTAAYEVQLILSPKLKNFFHQSDDSHLMNKIAFLAPGRALFAKQGSVVNLHKKYPALTFDGELRYQDSTGHGYVEPVRVDLNYLNIPGTDIGEPN